MGGSLRSDLPPCLTEHPYQVLEGKTWLQTKNGDVPLQVFGEHNLQNIQAAHLVCRQLGVTDKDSTAPSQLQRAAKRLQMLAETDDCTIFRISPFTVQTQSHRDGRTAAVPGRKLTACMELHTFSSLTRLYTRYKDSMKDAHQVS
jgi:UDP-N-acetylmuramate: L-alanyl-gamma-D-glutamyl-meso-diaminopimelate ligase